MMMIKNPQQTEDSIFSYPLVWLDSNKQEQRTRNQKAPDDNATCPYFGLDLFLAASLNQPINIVQTVLCHTDAFQSFLIYPTFCNFRRYRAIKLVHMTASLFSFYLHLSCPDTPFIYIATGCKKLCHARISINHGQQHRNSITLLLISVLSDTMWCSITNFCTF